MRLLALIILSVILKSSSCTYREPLPDPGFDNDFYFSLQSDKFNTIVYKNAKGMGDTLRFTNKTNLPLDMNDNQMNYQLFNNSNYFGTLILDYSISAEIRTNNRDYNSIFAECASISINNKSTLDSITAKSRYYSIDSFNIQKNMDFSDLLNLHYFFIIT
jgi:hypothetical protein